MRRRAFLALACGAAAAPVLAAEQVRTYRVGVLIPGLREQSSGPQWQAFVRRLEEEGFVEGRNLIFEARFAADFSLFQALASELVGLGVDLIVVRGPSPLRAASMATKSIPIVMVASSGDPVDEGYVDSLARPGRNITGMTFAVSLDRVARQLSLLREACGPISRVAVLWDLEMETYRRNWSPLLQRAAAQLGLGILGPYQTLNADAFAPAFARMSSAGAEAVLVVSGSVAFPNRASIGALAIQHRLPTIAAFKEFPRAGGLMSYGPNLTDLYRRAASFVVKILRGAAPGELPVENPTTYDLVINAKTRARLASSFRRRCLPAPTR